MCRILQNAHTCLYGNLVSEYFKCDPPSHAYMGTLFQIILVLTPNLLTNVFLVKYTQVLYMIFVMIKCCSKIICNIDSCICMHRHWDTADRSFQVVEQCNHSGLHCIIYSMCEMVLTLHTVVQHSCVYNK